MSTDTGTSPPEGKARLPHFGFTQHGKLPVHARTADHLPAGTAATRFNKWLAIKVTTAVGTMWCAYIFAAISITSLPSTLKEHSINADVQWVAQTFLQLVLLSVILVGQNLQGIAADARNIKQFEDTESLVTKADRSAEILDLLQQLLQENTELTTQVHDLVASLPGNPASLAGKGKGEH